MELNAYSPSTSFTYSPPQLSRRIRPLLGTYVEIVVFDSRPDVSAAITDAFRAMEKVQQLLSFHDPKSELSFLNNANGGYLQLSHCTLLALRLAKRIGQLSDDLFNSTVGGQLVLAGVLPGLPGWGGLRCGSWSDIEIRGSRVRLTRPVLITLDGIAKGLAVDLGVKALKDSGIHSGWINAGGDLRVFGEFDCPIWRRGMVGEMVYLGSVRDCAVATSQIGTSQENRFPGYIVFPDGELRPEQRICTVKARSAWLADALTKVAILSSSSSRVERLGGEILVESPFEIQ